MQCEVDRGLLGSPALAGSSRREAIGGRTCQASREERRHRRCRTRSGPFGRRPSVHTRARQTLPRAGQIRTSVSCRRHRYARPAVGSILRHPWRAPNNQDLPPWLPQHRRMSRPGCDQDPRGLKLFHAKDWWSLLCRQIQSNSCCREKQRPPGGAARRKSHSRAQRSPETERNRSSPVVRRARGCPWPSLGRRAKDHARRLPGGDRPRVPDRTRSLDRSGSAR